MAEPTNSYPESATQGGREATTDGEGEAALEAALAEHGESIADAVDRTDELADLLTTAILVVANADKAELEHVTDSTANLVEAADGLTTEEAAELATTVGDSADDLSDSLATVLALQREGHLDDLVRIATAFSESLSPEEVEKLATTVEDSGTEVVEALDVVLVLQREGHLEELVDLATTLSTLDIDADAARGMNTLLGALGEAERDSQPVGPLGALRQLRTRDARAGLGYLVAILKAQGRRLRNR